MLRRLAIKNYALIDDLQVAFDEGFTTITGETGAGKSILLESLGLVLGKRADRSALRDVDRKCVVEAEFAVGRYPQLRDFFKTHDLEYDEETLLRREIQPSGKSRAFVNDSPVTLEIMSRLGSLLIDVHSQHQTLELTDRDFQLHVVDALAGNTSLLQQYRKLRDSYFTSLRALDELKQLREETFKEQDYNEFLLEELEKVRLEEGMHGELESRHARLSNAEQIIETLSGAASLCQEEEYGLLGLQQKLRQLTARLAPYGPVFEQVHQRVQSLYIEADDLAQELQDLLSEQESDPGGLEAVGSQLQVLYDLQKKHGTDSVSGLIRIRERLQEEVDKTGGLDIEIEKAEKALGGFRAGLEGLAESLHERRKGVLPDFVDRLESRLAGLGMPNASFAWKLIPQEEFGPFGPESLELLFTANKGGRHGLLKKTASGGELSRIMMAIKSILAIYESLPTMMFDEIDTGVSGEISTKMAEIMHGMSAHMQIFAITHLPQVASRGHRQFKVYKEDQQGRTYTRMKLLDREERLRELAQMLGGKQASDAAISHARELLN